MMRAIVFLGIALTAAAGCKRGDAPRDAAPPPAPVAEGETPADGGQAVAPRETASPPARVVAEGETCAIGARAIATCGPLLTCKPRPLAPAAPTEPKPPSAPSGEGGPCGGVAGHHCAAGLTCDIPQNQAGVADAMGRCARVSTCVR